MFHEAGDGVHEIELGEDFEFSGGHFDENGGAFAAKELGNAFDGRVAGNTRKSGAHDFANDKFAKVFALKGEIEDLIFVDGANGIFVLEHGKLGNVLLLHRVQSVKHRLVGPRDDEFAVLASVRFNSHDIGGAERNFGFDITMLTHPAIVVDFAEVAHSCVRQESDDKIVFFQVACEAQSGGKASAS